MMNLRFKIRIEKCKKLFFFFAFCDILTLIFGGFIMDEQYLNIANQIRKHGIDKIVKKGYFSKNELLAILGIVSSNVHVSREDKSDFQEIFKRKRFLYHFDETQIAIISDTHIGHSEKTIEYLKRAYDFFDRLGIQVVLIGGDLFDGCMYYKSMDKNSAKEICMQQLQSFSEIYPNGFQNYVLLGNHDEVFLNLGIDLNQELSKYHCDFNVLGLGRAYFKCQTYQISLSHKVKEKFILPNSNDCDLYLKGHSHYYKWNQHTHCVQIPTCSQIIPFDSQKAKSGFLIVRFDEKRIISNHYLFGDNQIIRGDIERILTR